MNKYVKYFNKIEGSSRKKEDTALLIMSLKLKKELIKYYTLDRIKTLLKMNSKAFSKALLIELSNFNEKLQKYVIDEFINKFNKECIINYYLILLCNMQTENNIELRDITMESFKKSGLIKDIIYKNDLKAFCLTTSDDKKMHFKPRHKNIEQIEEARRKCHNISNFIAKQNKDRNVFIVTMLVDNFVGEKQYHTILVCNNIVNDYAQNIIMNYDAYKHLYKPNIISFTPAKKAHKEIEKLKAKDPEFNDSCADLLGYAIHKQMRKDKKRKNRN